MSHELPLGQIIDDKQQRDAIHIAVAPVVAVETLYPGQHIGFVDDAKTRVGTAAANRIGIVDPFLSEAVQPEQRFWMFLYPGTITSLRHDWTHPAFADAAPSKGAPPQLLPDKAVSEAWLRDFCRMSDCPEYETVMKAIQGEFENHDPSYYSSGGYIDNEYLHFDGRDAHAEIPDEFWTHAEIVLGKKLPLKPRSFSCSC